MCSLAGRIVMSRWQSVVLLVHSMLQCCVNTGRPSWLQNLWGHPVSLSLLCVVADLLIHQE